MNLPFCMNKRGFSFIFQIFLIIVMIILLVSVIIIISNKIPKFQKQIGENQENLAKLYLRGEKIQNYLKSSADSVKNEALIEFEENGHYADEMLMCGKKENYAMWKTKDKDCYPTKNSVRNGFAKSLLPKINPLIQNFNFYETNLQAYSPADIAIEENKIIGYPFNFLILSEEPFYSIPQSFSSEISGLININKNYDSVKILRIIVPKFVPFVYAFNYDAIKEDMTIIDNNCQSEENVVGANNLEICAIQTIGNINTAKRKLQKPQFLYQLNCDEYDNPVEAKLYNLAEKFNECRNSYDNYCQCRILDEDMEGITISGKFISIEEDIGGVKRRYSYELEEDFPPYAKGREIVKIEQIKAFEENNPLIKEINSLCRPNGRTLKICATREFEVSIKDIENSKIFQKEVKTKFAVEIGDKAKPESVESLSVNEKLNQISFKPSKSGDVKEYKILFVNKEIENPDWKKATEYDSKIQRALNLDYLFNLTLDITEYNLSSLSVKVVPIDFEGNEGGEI